MTERAAPGSPEATEPAPNQDCGRRGLPQSVPSPFRAPPRAPEPLPPRGGSRPRLHGDRGRRAAGGPGGGCGPSRLPEARALPL